MGFPKSYDAGITATFALTSGTLVTKHNNRADFELELKKAKELGFVKTTVSGTTTYVPMTVVTAITVTEI